MYLVVGLGNPGKQYEATRHNMGFDTVDRLVEDYNVPQGGVKFNAMYGKTMIGGEKVILMKPLSLISNGSSPHHIPHVHNVRLQYNHTPVHAFSETSCQISDNDCSQCRDLAWLHAHRHPQSGP